MKLTNNLCLRLSKEQLVNISKKSEELGMPKSTFCRMAVINFIKEQKSNTKEDLLS
jgi:predicted DNA binding CopG/RHH family protein